MRAELVFAGRINVGLVGGRSGILIRAGLANVGLVGGNSGDLVRVGLVGGAGAIFVGTPPVETATPSRSMLTSSVPTGPTAGWVKTVAPLVLTPQAANPFSSVESKKIHSFRNEKL